MTVSQNTVLEKNTGIIGYKLSCDNDPISIIAAFPIGTEIKNNIFKHGGEIGMICAAGDLQTEKVKAGKYFIGVAATAGNSLTFDSDKAMKFTIKPNQINYIGDISTSGYSPYSYGGYTKKYLLKRFISKNNKDAFVKELEEKHPKLIARYPVEYTPAAY